MLPAGCVKECRACSHREKTLSESLEQKTAWLKNKLATWKSLFSPIVYLPEEKQYHYRYKVCLTAWWDNQKWLIGLKQNKKVIPVPDCPLHAISVNLTLQSLLKYLPSYDKFPLTYYVHSGKQAVLVVKAADIADLSWINNFIDEFAQHGNEGLWLHFHPSAGRKVFGKTGWRLVYGSPYSKNEKGLLYGPASFQQLIPELFYHAALRCSDFFDIQEGDVVIDLFSGIGSTLKIWHEAGAKAAGVELNGEAVHCAMLNVPEAYILRGRCSQRLPQLNEWLEHQHFRRLLVFVNPPRTGLEPETTAWIIKNARPSRMAYLSCSAGTLHRDLHSITAANYQVVNIIPYDFFPATHHVECLVLLEKFNK